MKAVKFVSADGKEQVFSLKYLLDHNAMLVTDVNGEPLSESFGGANQLWIEGCSAKYFLRDIVSVSTIEVDHVEDPTFEPKGNQHQNRPNISASIVGSARLSYAPGDTVDVEGWADDYDKAITAIRLSFDGGETFEEMPTPEAKAGKLTSWRFSFAAKEPGTHMLEARAVNEDGKVSPIAAQVSFVVA